MRKKYAFGLVIALVATQVFAVVFNIDYSWSPALPTNQFLATTSVNATAEARSYAALPTTQVGEQAAMVYSNSWFQLYAIVNKNTTVPWQPSSPASNQCQVLGCSPILLDLGRDGVLLAKSGMVVMFDIDGDGVQEPMQWVRPGGDEAFLVLDRNGNRTIDSGTELFGNHTPVAGSDELPDNGFVALAQYDWPDQGGNGDGVITPDDDIWGSLELWRDANADGQTQPSELASLASAGIQRLGITPRKSNRRDRAGNLLMYWDKAVVTCSERRKSERRKGDNDRGGRCLIDMVDVFFVT